MIDPGSSSDPDLPPPCVLVVDDDPNIRNLLRSALEAVGYEIETAGNGDDALVILGQRCPNALIADLIMPGVSGDELARRAHELCPNTHLIFMSGYPPDKLRSLGITQVVFMEKPIAMHALRTMLKNLMGR